MDKCVLVLEDEPDLARLVRELLEETGYTVVDVSRPEDLIAAAATYAPCVALIDGLSPTSFDMWWLGPELSKLGVPPIAFTAHESARAEYAADSHGFVGVVSKPFDADEFLAVVDTICWEEHRGTFDDDAKTLTA